MNSYHSAQLREGIFALGKSADATKICLHRASVKIA